MQSLIVLRYLRTHVLGAAGPISTFFCQCRTDGEGIIVDIA